MAERKRNKEIHFYVTDEERKLIRRKMIESKTKNMGAYLRKMSIDGYIVNTDTTPLKKQYEEMHKIGVNIHQIAKKVNTTGDLYPEEMKELKAMVSELWHILRKIISITISSLMQQVLLIITNMFPISGATIKSAGSVIAFARKMDLPPVCRLEKKAKIIKRTWNTIVAPVGKPSYVSQLIRQSGLPSTMRNFYRKCS